MSLVSTDLSCESRYYIPHHCVLKPGNVSTRLRVVFNASAKLSNEKSLNDCLYVGPKLQQNVVTILLNFRVHEYVMCAGIKRIY